MGMFFCLCLKHVGCRKQKCKGSTSLWEIMALFHSRRTSRGWPAGRMRWVAGRCTGRCSVAPSAGPPAAAGHLGRAVPGLPRPPGRLAGWSAAPGWGTSSPYSVKMKTWIVISSRSVTFYILLRENLRHLYFTWAFAISNTFTPLHPGSTQLHLFENFRYSSYFADMNYNIKL